MQVVELAKDLKVSPEVVLTLLRELGIPVGGADATVSEADVARILARVERERRAGHKSLSEAVMAAVEEAQSSHKPRRRRRRRSPRTGEAEAPEEEAASEPSAEAFEDEAADQAGIEEADEPEVEVVSADSDPVPEDAPVAAEPQDELGSSDEPEALEAEVEESLAPAVEDSDEPEIAGEELLEVVAGAGEDVAGPEVEPVDTEASMVAEETPGEKPQPVRAGAPRGPVRRMRKPAPAAAASAGPAGTVRIQAEGYTPDGRRKPKDKKKGRKGRSGVDQGAVQENIQRVMAEMKGGGKRRRRKGSKPSREEVEQAQEVAREEREREATTVKVNEFLTVAELSELVDVSATEIIGSAFKNLGLMVTINQRLDFDQIELLLEEFGFTAVREDEYGAETVEEVEEEEDPESLRPRPPVVTVMGHVDHGKTRLLDAVRNTNVVAGESGGITQHIGAYHVELPDGRSISFLDTPGHAAFTAMRARGADVTDVVILVVAADDAVMPQTVEAISHAKNAGVPVVVAINKIDLPAADAGRVKQELLQHDITVEDFGGDVLSAEISAKQGQGIEDLLDKVLLQAEMLELRANPDREAQGAVIEAQLDVGKGPVVSILVQKGTLRVGDPFIVGLYDGRVRALLDERGNAVEEAGPGIPVQVLGASGVPQAGDVFQAMEAERAAEIAGTRQRLDREKQLRIKERGIKLGDFSQLLAEGETSSLPLIIKGDVDGSVQAVSDALGQLSTDEVQVEIVHRAVGAINESDVLLATTAGAIIIGFRVRPDGNARALAERDDIDIHVYDVIYEAVDDVKAAMEGLLSPEKRERITGAAEVREVFKITKVGTIAGCYVTEGLINRNNRVRLIRDGIVIYTGDLASLKRFKDDVREVKDGFECGIGIQNFNDVKVGDMIEAFVVEEFARTL
jgi:translation initiation factor IF-2